MPDHVDRIVQAWRRERPDLDLAALALLGRLFRTAHLADAALAEPLAGPRAPVGLVRPAGALRRAGEPYALKPTQLMQTMLLSSRGMTKRLDRLADAGLVERRPDPNDRRGTLVRLTSRGKTTIDTLLQVHLSNEQQLLASFSPTQQPAPQAEWLPYLAEILDAPPPRRVSEEEAEEQIGAQAVYYGTQLRAASNAKAKSELGLALEYPSWREGFRELFG
jgi:DNA-binding MarR family transcriptional regulator